MIFPFKYSLFVSERCYILSTKNLTCLILLHLLKLIYFTKLIFKISINFPLASFEVRKNSFLSVPIHKMIFSITHEREDKREQFKSHLSIHNKIKWNFKDSLHIHIIHKNIISKTKRIHRIIM